MASEIESLLDYALNIGASDLIVTEDAPSAVRVAGRVCAIPNAPVLPFGSLLEFLGSLEGESGTFIGGPWLNTKWRVKYFREALGNAAIFRPLMAECPNFSDLGAPASLDNLLGLSSGLVVFGGPACSGKTVSATSYVSAMCSSSFLRFCNLDAGRELPVKIGESLMLANTVGTTSEKLEQGLRSGTDLFWVGDFDESTLISVLQAAEAGALVVMNVTAGNAVGVVDALLSASSSENRDLVRTMLAAALKAVVVQRLLPAAAEGAGAVPAWEILYNTQNVAAHIRSGDHFKLPSIMAASSSEGMLLMDDCLAELVRSGYVTAEDAGRYVSNPARLA
jgi:twitching motility protein PilT